jgi:hypothetical protein
MEVTMKKNSLIIILFFCCNLLQAQEVRLGFTVEENIIKIESAMGQNSLNSNYPGLQLTLGVYPSDKLAIEARAGGVFDLQYYSGVDLGIFSKYNFSHPFYAVGGIMYHSNNSDGANSFTVSPTSFILPSLGIGLDMEKIFYLELLFQYAGNQKVGTERNGAGDFSDVNLKWALKLGLGYSLRL